MTLCAIHCLQNYQVEILKWQSQLHNLISYHYSKCKFRTYHITENSSKLYMNKACQTCLTTTTTKSLHNVRRRTKIENYISKMKFELDQCHLHKI